MNIHPVHLHHGGGGIEVFILQLSQSAAIHGVGIVGSKARHVEQVRPAANLLIGGKGNAYPAVFRRIRRGKQRGQGHNLRHARLVVSPQNALPVGDNQILSLEALQEIKPVDDHAVFQGNGFAIIVGNHLSMGGALDTVGGVHMGNQAHPGRMVSLGGDGRINVSMGIHPGIRHAHFLQFFHQRPGQLHLAGRGGAALRHLTGSGLKAGVLQKALGNRHHVFRHSFPKMACSSSCRLSRRTST